MPNAKEAPRGERVALEKITTKGIYGMMRKECVRRPASEKVWEKVVCEMDVRKMWGNLRVK